MEFNAEKSDNNGMLYVYDMIGTEISVNGKEKLIKIYAELSKMEFIQIISLQN